MAAERKAANFVHLRVKSAYSLLEGALRPKELAKLTREMGMPAVAVTDTNNLFGVFEISETLAKEGVQPIVGCLLAVDLDEFPALPGSRFSRNRHSFRCWCRTMPVTATSRKFSATLTWARRPANGLMPIRKASPIIRVG